MSTYREFEPAHRTAYKLSDLALAESQRLFNAQRRDFHRQIMAINNSNLDNTAGHTNTSDLQLDRFEAQWEKANDNGTRVADYRLILCDLVDEANYLQAALHSKT